MRRVPSARSRTRPAAFSTDRCCDTAGRLTGRSSANSPTARGRSATRSYISRRVGSAKAARADFALGISYGKLRLTSCQRPLQAIRSHAMRSKAAAGILGLALLLTGEPVLAEEQLVKLPTRPGVE